MLDLEYHEYANLFPLLQGPDYEELKKDIKEHGLIQPIWLFEGKILDGRNRYRACVETGTTPIFSVYEDSRECREGVSPAKLAWSLNVPRRHLTPSQKSLLALDFLRVEEELARKRMNWRQADQGDGVQKSAQDDGVEIFPPHEAKGKARDFAAQTAGINPHYVQSAKTVVARGAPELVQAVREGRISIDTAATISTRPKDEQVAIVQQPEKKIISTAKQIKATAVRDKRMEKIVAISENNAPLTGQKVPVIYADPPWRYDYTSTENRAIENQYPTMTLEEICALPVSQEVALDDCVLFLWATSPKLEESLQVIKAWGFTYRTCAVWDKEMIGMGYYFRQQHELLLVATKGEIPAPGPEARVSSVVRERRGEHSAKPDVFYEIIEAMYPKAPKLEMFCRKARTGWLTWGNQANGK